MRKRIVALFLLIFLLCPLFACAEGELQGFSKKDGYVYVTLGRYPQSIDSGNEKADGGCPEDKTWTWNVNPLKETDAYSVSVDPILWRVLTVDDEKAYLASEYVLFAHPMHVDYNEYVKIGKDFGSTDLCAYLNGAFSDAAFTEAEREMLAENATFGQVFLLDSEDVKNQNLGMGTGNGLKCWGTEYAIRVTGLYVYNVKDGSPSPYWTLNQSTSDKRHGRCTKLGGKLGHIVSDRKDEGVRPAVFLKIDSYEIGGGSGTKNDPYQLLPRQSL